MSLVNGIAIYDLNNIHIFDAYEFSKKLFESLNITPNSISYFYTHKPDKNGEVISVKFVDICDLEKEICQGNINDFRMSYLTDDIHWDISFSYSNKNGIGGLSCIDIQFLDSILNIDDINLIEFIEEFFSRFQAVYGIAYQLNGYTSTAYNYIFSFDGSKIYKNENSTKWLYQLPNRSKQKPLFFEKLRMVYIINLLNVNHLNLNISGKTLKDWILSDNKNGSLKKLNNQNFLWIVRNSELERVNKILGEAGALISWFSTKPEKKKLPW